jgi:hypothetical protein
MSARTLAITILSLLSALVRADDDQHVHDHHAVQTPSPLDPPIKITINPEARVSVVRSGSFTAPVPCGTAAELPLKIINKGFVTSRLEASLVGNTPAGVTLNFDPEPLTGVPEELRELWIILPKAELTDITISFKLRNDIPDLGGRDRIHFLLRCM